MFTGEGKWVESSFLTQPEKNIFLQGHLKVSSDDVQCLKIMQAGALPFFFDLDEQQLICQKEFPFQVELGTRW